MSSSDYASAVKVVKSSNIRVGDFLLSTPERKGFTVESVTPHGLGEVAIVALTGRVSRDSEEESLTLSVGEHVKVERSYLIASQHEVGV